MQNNISFTISDKIENIFNIALSISKDDRNEVIEKLISSYATDILQKQIEIMNQMDIKKDELVSSVSNKESKAYRRFEGWAKKSNQINHKVIKTFYTCREGDVANRNKMREEFIKLNPDMASYLFDSNLNSLATESGNSHGRAFVFNGDEVYMAEDIKELFEKYKSYFL